MDSGTLDRRITIQRNTPTQNAIGEPIDSWADLVTVWAAFKPSGARESYSSESQQLDAIATVRFLLRWRADVTITAKDRVSWDGETYNIHGVQQIGRHDGLELICSAKADD